MICLRLRERQVDGVVVKLKISRLAIDVLNPSESLARPLVLVVVDGF